MSKIGIRRADILIGKPCRSIPGLFKQRDKRLLLKCLIGIICLPTGKQMRNACLGIHKICIHVAKRYDGSVGRKMRHCIPFITIEGQMVSPKRLSYDEYYIRRRRRRPGVDPRVSIALVEHFMATVQVLSCRKIQCVWKASADCRLNSLYQGHGTEYYSKSYKAQYDRLSVRGAYPLPTYIHKYSRQGNRQQKHNNQFPIYQAVGHGDIGGIGKKNLYRHWCNAQTYGKSEITQDSTDH